MSISLKRLYQKVRFSIFPKHRGADRRGKPNGLTGDYAQWRDAVEASSGYDSNLILEKTRHAALKVKYSKAIFERDSVLFDEIHYSWPILSGLMWISGRDGELNVLDFGGSLGSAYYQNRAFLETLPQVSWSIVEQAEFVAVGQAEFADETLRFYKTIADCLVENRPNLILLGGVLQYLEHPFAILDELLNLPCDVILLDRTPFWDGERDWLAVQNVPPVVYDASYPSWIFAKTRFYDHLAQRGWDVMTSFENEDMMPAPIKFKYEGLFAVRSGSLS